MKRVRTTTGGASSALEACDGRKKAAHMDDDDSADPASPSERNVHSCTLVRSLGDIHECDVCRHFLAEPGTATCGHTLCRECWLVVVHARRKCPLCKAEMTDVPSINFTMREMLERIYPKRMAERVAELAEKRRIRGPFHETTDVRTLVAALTEQVGTQERMRHGVHKRRKG